MRRRIGPSLIGLAELYLWMTLLILLAVGCARETPVVQPTITVGIESPTPSPTATSTPTRAPTAPPTRTPTLVATVPPTGQPAIVPILMYHHLGDLSKDATELQLTWTVSAKSFEDQMGWLASHGYHTVTMEQLSGYLKHGYAIPTKPVVVSFDDGWEEGYSVAFPLLKRENYTGTFFVYTNAVGHSKSLSWTQVEAMATAGMDIESHTVSHPHLRTLSADALAKELADSKAIIEKHTGKRVTSFAYPDGEYDAVVVDAVKRAGYESAVTIASGFRQSPDQVYTLHRIRVSYKDTLQEFASRLP